MTVEKCSTCEHVLETSKGRLYCKKSLADKDDCGEYKNKQNDILWCEQHKLETRPTFLCYMYDVKAGIDAKHTPADQMKCETCTFCCRKEKDAK